VECDDLWTGQVVTSFHTLGKVDGEETVVVDNLVCAPAFGGVVVAMIKDLEPSVSDSLVSSSVVDFLKVNGTRALVATVEAFLGRVIRPGADLESEESAILDRLNAGDTLGTANV
jgi:hypothetical protein